jgi:hypothetical protein
MRKLVCTLLLLAPLVTNAQRLKLFAVNVAAGYAVPMRESANDDYSKAGFLYSIEGQYQMINHLVFGLRFEQAFVQRPEFLDNNLFFASKANAIYSAALTASYLFNTGRDIQPYIGVGPAFYHVDPSEQITTGLGLTVRYPLPATNNIGGLARIGVKYGRVNLEGNYNLVSNTSVTNNATGRTMTAKNSYFSVKAGFTIGSKFH